MLKSSQPDQEGNIKSKRKINKERRQLKQHSWTDNFFFLHSHVKKRLRINFGQRVQ